MSLLPRPEITALKVGTHGGPNRAEFRAMGLDPERIIDFSVSSNPYAPPPGMKTSLLRSDINRYPDSGATELRQCLAEKLGVAPDNILVGSGSMELIRLVALSYFGRGDRVLVLEPAFDEYEIVCQLTGAETIKQWAKAENGFVPRIEETVDLIHRTRPKGIFVGNPNNPTGIYLPRHDIEAILESSNETLFILDEAFIAFVDRAWSSLDLIHQGNVILVRSMTKDYGLAGLRLGYAIAGQGIMENLRRVCPPWNVNIAAQRAGVSALERADWLERCRLKMETAKHFLIDGLHRLGLATVPSSANFFLVKVGDARAFRAALLGHDILVRDCTSFGLPEYIRIAVRTMPDCRKFITAVRRLSVEQKR